MFGLATIRRMSKEATMRARRQRLAPVNPAHQSGTRVPFLGDYVPAGYAAVGDPFMVDGSGWGADDEPAMTQAAFVAHCHAHPAQFFGIVEAGQFQVVVQAFAATAHEPN